jgi:Zn-dependent alcohol dehydrogenase
MVKKLTIAFGVALGCAAIAGPAFAVQPIHVPEPSSLALFSAGGVGVGALYIANRWLRRK